MAQAKTPDELIPRELSKDAKLFNVNAATLVRFFGATAMYLPVAVSDSPAGRETVYKLPIGTKTLMGIYISENRIYQDYYTRTGDRDYTVSKETLSGKVVFSGKGTLRVLDDRVGAGELIVESDQTSGEEAAATVVKCHCRRRWYVWSFIGTEDCDCTGGRPTVEV